MINRDCNGGFHIDADPVRGEIENLMHDDNESKLGKTYEPRK